MFTPMVPSSSRPLPRVCRKDPGHDPEASPHTRPVRPPTNGYQWAHDDHPRRTRPGAEARPARAEPGDPMIDRSVLLARHGYLFTAALAEDERRRLPEAGSGINRVSC